MTPPQRRRSRWLAALSAFLGALTIVALPQAAFGAEPELTDVLIGASELVEPPPQPNLIAPAPGAFVNDSTPTLEWVVPDGAIADPFGSYIVAIDGEFAAEFPRSTTSYAVPEPLADGAHTWGVTGGDLPPPGAGGERTFVVDTVRPLPFAIRVLPVVNEPRPTISWSAIDNPGGSGLDMTRVLLNNVTVARGDETLTSWTPATDLPEGVPLTVRVSVRDRAGNWRSRTVTFSYDSTAPGPTDQPTSRQGSPTVSDGDILFPVVLSSLKRQADFRVTVTRRGVMDASYSGSATITPWSDRMAVRIPAEVLLTRGSLRVTWHKAGDNSTLYSALVRYTLRTQAASQQD